MTPTVFICFFRSSTSPNCVQKTQNSHVQWPSRSHSLEQLHRSTFFGPTKTPVERAREVFFHCERLFLGIQVVGSKAPNNETTWGLDHFAICQKHWFLSKNVYTLQCSSINIQLLPKKENKLYTWLSDSPVHSNKPSHGLGLWCIELSSHREERTITFHGLACGHPSEAWKRNNHHQQIWTNVNVNPEVIIPFQRTSDSPGMGLSEHEQMIIWRLKSTLPHSRLLSPTVGEVRSVYIFWLILIWDYLGVYTPEI